jgi:hypothetical protein
VNDAFEIIPLTEDLYDDWDAFVFQSDDAWFWHHSLWMKYSLAYRPARQSRNLSFFVKDNSGYLAICPLFLEISPDLGVKEFTYGDRSTPRPALLNSLKSQRRFQIEKFIHSHLDELAKEHEVKRTVMRDIVLRRAFLDKHPPQCNPLLKYDFLDCSYITNVIDLRHDPHHLLKDMRKGHRYDIRRGLKKYKFKAYFKENVTEDIFEKYRMMHFKAAGRATRPKVTFDLMREMVASGNAVLFSAEDEGEIRMFEFTVFYNKCAYYASEADDPEYITDIPVGHMLQWQSMNWLKQQGCEFYETGYQYYGPQLHFIPTAKDISISLFKRIFGGRIVPYFRGEKYYDADFCRKILLDRVESFYKNFHLTKVFS